MILISRDYGRRREELKVTVLFAHPASSKRKDLATRDMEGSLSKER